MKNVFRAPVCGLLMAGLVPGTAFSRAEDTIKIGFIAPFSGAFAANGDAWLKMLTYAMNKTNEGGARWARSSSWSPLTTRSHHLKR